MIQTVHLQYEKNRPIIYKSLLLLYTFFMFIFIMMKVPILWDDWGRYGIQGSISASWKFALAYYNTNSGRLFSSFISILLLHHKIIWAFFGAISFSILLWMISSINKKNSVWPYLLVFFLIICSPIELLRQTYTWICGFGYYFIPLLSAITYIYIQRMIFVSTPAKTTILNTLVGFILGCLTQLFVENISIAALYVGLFVFVYTLVKHKVIAGAQIGFIIASLIGIIIMFLSPGYKTLGQTDEWVKLTLLGKILKQAPAIVEMYLKVCAIPLVLAILLLVYNICKRTIRLYSGKFWFIVFIFSSSVFAILPLFLASYFGERNFLYSYYFLIILCVILLEEISIKKKVIFKLILIGCIICSVLWGSILMVIYNNASVVEEKRGIIINEYKKNPIGILYLPKVKYERLFWGINPYFHDNNLDYHVIVYKRYWGLQENVNIEYEK